MNYSRGRSNNRVYPDNIYAAPDIPGAKKCKNRRCRLWACVRERCKIKSDVKRSALCEFLGTLILCLVLVAGRVEEFTSLDIINRYQAFSGTTMALMIAVLITGAHANPAVTFALCIGGEVPWYRLPIYWLSQMIGGYIGSLLGILTYWSRTQAFGPDAAVNNRQPCEALIRPQKLSSGTFIIGGVLVNTIFIMAVFAMIDKRNLGVPSYLLPLYLALVAQSLESIMGLTFTTPMNPAKEMTKLAAATVGCQTESEFMIVVVWSLVVLFENFFGAALGAFMYILTIGGHLNEVSDDSDSDVDLEQKNRRGTTIITRQKSDTDITSADFSQEGGPQSKEEVKTKKTAKEKQGKV